MTGDKGNVEVTDLTAADFSNFFTSSWDHQPFAWQRTLAERVLERTESPWPEAIALPTASGKTACMDIAVFALAAQASRMERGETITAPRRIFFVVDRRVIVDEAYERARRLAQKLDEADGGILKGVADNLRLIARGGPNELRSRPTAGCPLAARRHVPLRSLGAESAATDGGRIHR